MEIRDFEPEVLALADALRGRGWRLATAESCTGGLIAAACTAVAGSSDWFERGFVSYSNTAKTELLGVDAALIAEHGAVSEAVARAMALGAVERARVELSVAVTGIAGPGGATPGKPVGTVWLAVALAAPHSAKTSADSASHSASAGSSGLVPQGLPGGVTVAAWRLQIDGDRAAVREHTVLQALQRLRVALG